MCVSVSVCVRVFASTVSSCAQTLPILNSFLTSLCVRVAELVDPRDANYTREVLSSQLPHIKGSNGWADHTRLTPGSLEVIVVHL